MTTPALATTGPVHATAVARFGRDGWRGVLLTGASGMGKSDLALRLIEKGWRLVADDYSHVWRSGEALYATAPPTIAGRIEARGLGILSVPAQPLARVVAVIECVQDTVERLPDPQITPLHGVDLPHHRIDVRTASAAALTLATIVAL